MIAIWMGYCLLVSLLLGGAALAAERGFHLYERPIRWSWLGAVLGSLALPVAAYVLPTFRPLSTEPLRPVVGGALDGTAFITGPLTLSTGSQSFLARIDGPLLALWLIGSLALLAFYLRSYLRLKRRARNWASRTVGGRTVFVSRRLGPAVMGFFRSLIVIPEWALEMEEEPRRIVVLHEEEHLRVGDHRLLFFGLASLIVMPWNLPLWWQARRLRLAVEIDCDRRVLSTGAHPGAYGALLLEVGRRASGVNFIPAAFSEPRSLLEKRVRSMTSTPSPRRRQKVVAAVFLSGLLLGAACAAPAPPRPAEPGPAETPRPDQAPPPGVVPPLGEETPFTVAPRIKDRRTAVEIVKRSYPKLLKDAGIGGTAIIWVYMDTDGRVKRTQVQKSSGNDALDEAARAAAMQFEFTPARNRDKVVAVWIALPITFAPDSRGQSEPLGQLRATLRMIATVQEERYREAGRYYRSIEVEALQSVIEEGVEIVFFQAHDSGWAAVAQNRYGECAMFYGYVSAPRPYARAGRAVCAQ